MNMQASYRSDELVELAHVTCHPQRVYRVNIVIVRVSSSSLDSTRTTVDQMDMN